MRPELYSLIVEYQRYVSEACRLLNEKLRVDDLLRAWLLKEVPQRGWLDDEQKSSFYFHGVGCRVKFGSIEVDFDFGPQRRYDGFDAWRLVRFAETVALFEQFRDVDSLKAELNELGSTGALIHLRGAMSDHLFYFTAAGRSE